MQWVSGRIPVVLACAVAIGWIAINYLSRIAFYKWLFTREPPLYLELFGSLYYGQMGLAKRAESFGLLHVEYDIYPGLGVMVTDRTMLRLVLVQAIALLVLTLLASTTPRSIRDR
jgi:hypothetical protein